MAYLCFITYKPYISLTNIILIYLLELENQIFNLNCIDNHHNYTGGKIDRHMINQGSL